MAKLRDLYEKNVNIMEYFREKNSTEKNSISAILASYDMQAGSYVGSVKAEKISNNYHINSIRSELTPRQYLTKLAEFMSEIINGLDFETILEAGVGEATTMSFLLKKLKSNKAYGFDISASRIQVAKEFAKEMQVEANFFVGDINKIALPESSVDVVYTVHALEPNSGNEKKLVDELFRVCKKYLILVEPSYELGNDETRANIEKNKYIKNLKKAVDTLDGELLRHELCPVGTYSNQPAIYVIKKNSKVNSDMEFVCPVCKKKLDFENGNYFCSDCCLVYPVLKGIPILKDDNGILFSKYMGE